MKKTNKIISDQPFISVVMPVYNAELYVREAIESILDQTYQNFEFIIVDDASTDSTWKILKEYAKKSDKIILMRNKRNIKQAKTVMRALDKARGTFVARMDADDISLPNRLKQQVAYLQKHPETVAVGGQCLLIDKEGITTGEKSFPTKFKDVYPYSFMFCPAQQPTLMVNRGLLPLNFEYYNHNMAPVEDAEFLFKLFQYGKVENLSQTTLLYRIHGENSSLKNFKKSFFLTLLSRIRAVALYNYKPTLKGVVVTIAQAITVFLLPQALTFSLYKIAKKLEKPTSITASPTAHAPASSLSLSAAVSYS